ncbi:hypothetical protein DIZ76_011284 [Coccidioides immitis]|nr:hypothetical protein DIZ76_011284 [Coccidioides immitis]
MGSHSDLPAMQTNPKIIFFTDFDGTITLKDSAWQAMITWYAPSSPPPTHQDFNGFNPRVICD